MNGQPHYDTQITTQALMDAGFHKLESCRFSNGSFDLILTDTGSAILYTPGNTKSVSCITDVHILRSFINYNIISSLGISRQ